MTDLNDDYFLSGFTVIMYIPREHRLEQVRIIKGTMIAYETGRD